MCLCVLYIWHQLVLLHHLHTHYHLDQFHQYRYIQTFQFCTVCSWLYREATESINYSPFLSLPFYLYWCNQTSQYPCMYKLYLSGSFWYALHWSIYFYILFFISRCSNMYMRALGYTSPSESSLSCKVLEFSISLQTSLIQ